MVLVNSRLHAENFNNPLDEQKSCHEREWIALLGRRDEPTDGVEDYCKFLGQALADHGLSLTLMRVPWAERGWFSAGLWLWRESADWRGRRVLVQYTALSWSRRGFSLGLLPLLALLMLKNVSIAVVFHDPAAYAGNRLVDHVRRAIQHFVMKGTYALADRAIIPVSPAHLPWLGSRRRKAVFIPVGSNIPVPLEHPKESVHLDERVKPKTISVFGITPGEAGRREMNDIRTIVQAAVTCNSQIHLCAFGRGTLEAEPVLRELFETMGIRLSVLGLLPATRIGDILAASDVQVDVRAPISSRRGSAIAGIVCGTPVIGFESSETDSAIREAGVLLFPRGDIKALAQAIMCILRDDSFQEDLRRRNYIASEKYFSWKAISGHFLDALQ